MKYAVIQLAGKQYKVAQGEKLVVNRLTDAVGAELKISDVLLTADNNKVTVGTPLVDKAVVTLKVVSHQAGPKLRVSTYKAKSRYHRTLGHRQAETTVEVVDLS